MTRRVLIVQHDHCSPPGAVAERFRERGYEETLFQIVPEADFENPGVEVEFPDVRGFDAIVVMGSYWSAWDDDLIGSWLRPEMEMLREAVSHIPGEIVVQPFSTLLMHFAEELNANVIIRGLRAVADPDSLRRAQAEVAQVRAEDSVVQYIVDVARATRRSPSLALGVSPRGAIALLRTARAWAYLQGRDFITPDDVKTMAPSTLGHRARLTTEADLEGSQIEAVLAATLAAVPVPR